MDNIGSWTVPPTSTRMVMSLNRKGSGATVFARVTIRMPNYLEGGMSGKVIDTFDFTADEQLEVQEKTFDPGNYIADVMVTAMEGLRGDFDFEFKIDKYPAIVRRGSANTSSAPNDTRSFAGHFNMMLVEPVVGGVV